MSLLTLGATSLATSVRSVEAPTPMQTPVSIPSPMPMPKAPIEPMGEPVEATPMKGKKASGNTIVDVAVGNGSFKTLTAALKAADLVDVLQSDGPFTVFAPTDAAFAKLPKGTVEFLLKPENKSELVRILTYHVVSSKVLSTDLKSGKVQTAEGSTIDVKVGKQGVMVNKSKVTGADVPASNGVIHVIDTVLLPPDKTAATGNTIVDVAVKNGSFKTLTAALTAADLVGALQGDGPFTVFAPTDAAFAKLPKGTVEFLLKPENKSELVRILAYHVVSGKVLSTDLKSGKVKTLEGSAIDVKVGKQGVMLNKSKVTGADVPASNGVIHVVDTVLLPPAKPTASKPSSKPAPKHHSK